jgi:hypothetical protein
VSSSLRAVRSCGSSWASASVSSSRFHGAIVASRTSIKYGTGDALFPDLTYPSEPYPRPLVTVTLPLSLPHFATLLVPPKLSAAEWDRLVNALAAMRPGLVDDSR